VRKILYKDEKGFTLEVLLNRQNDCVYGRGERVLKKLSDFIVSEAALAKM
jgi:hypothetical protein